jgi:hypothetical protein
MLAPSDRPTSQLSFIWAGAADLPGNACGLGAAGRPADAGAYIDWLRQQQSLVVGPLVLRKFSFVNAEQFDISVDDANACQYGTPRFVVLQPYGAGAGCCYGYQLTSGSRIRAFVFERDRDVVAAFAVAVTDDELNILIARIEPVLATIRFDPVP